MKQFVIAAVLFVCAGPAVAQLPQVPKGFKIELVAKEPLVRNPCSVTFGARGRMFVGMGPQYRHPTPKTRGDSVVILLDKDGDGKFDTRQTFATGFNCIQGLAWHGQDLWVANAPDLTVVRDTNGDDVADKYTLLYTDLGNLEHGLHGLNWGPDGRLYMSKGNSKGYTRPGRVAPKAFRELWGSVAPAGTPDFPPPKVFTPQTYKHAFHHPADDWGREGGVLVCDDMGKNLEIVSRGFRNPWDIGFDNEFNFQGTDNDQNAGDRVFMSYFGAHYGWGHPWSANWTGKNHLPTAPITGPVFHGSGTGIVFYADGQFPAEFDGVWFFNDWLRRTTYVYRPTWKGALIQPKAGNWTEFIRGSKLLYKPTDIDIGPDGSLYVLGWGNSYGATYDKQGRQTNEGRIWRVTWTGSPRKQPRARSTKPLAQRTVAELIADFRGPLPIWRSNAQDELVRRGAAVVTPLMQTLDQAKLTRGQETWVCWTLGRITQERQKIDRYLLSLTRNGSLNKRIQAVRISGFRARRTGTLVAGPGLVLALSDKNARVRFAAVQAIRRGRSRKLVPPLLTLIGREQDRVVFYAAWQSLRALLTVQQRKTLLRHTSSGVKQAAMLSLAEDDALTRADARLLLADDSDTSRELYALWTSKSNGNPLLDISPQSRQFVGRVVVNVVPGLKPAEVRFTADGSTPTAKSRPWGGRLTLTKTTTLKFAIFIHGHRVGRVAEAIFTKSKTEVAASDSGMYGVTAKSGRLYNVAGGLQVGRRAYVDRAYTYKSVPADLRGSFFIQTANDDSGSQSQQTLTMNSVVGGTLYVGFDVRIRNLPEWLPGQGKNAFVRTKQTVKTTDATFQLYRRKYSAGAISLGGNSTDGQGGGRSNYVVIFQPAPLAERKSTTSVASVVPLIRQGNKARGKALFFSSAVGCAKCHRIDGKKSFGPDLAHLVRGNDADGKFLVTSVLKPSAQIKEGFTTQLVVTAEGKVYRGVLQQESGQQIVLLQSDLKRVAIRKKSIKKRVSQQISPMPAYNKLLSAQQLADLAAWLKGRK